MRETYAPVLLRRKCRKSETEPLEKDVTPPPRIAGSLLLWTSVTRPVKMLALCPDVFFLSLYTTFVYGVYYIFLTTMSRTFEEVYDFGPGVVGLAYIGLGIGACAGMLICGLVSDAMVKRMSKDGEIKPHYRLPPIIPGSVFTPIGLFWFGWAVEGNVHWIVPITGTLFIGVGVAACFVSLMLKFALAFTHSRKMPITYLIDSYPTFAASAVAANALLRSIGGTVLPLAGPSLYSNLGQGCGNSLLAFISLLVCPMTVALFKYGEHLRARSKFESKT
jgi:hypothetical protein